MAPVSIPRQSTFFIQSLVPEHAELYLLLSMVVPVPWLERVPTYKEQQETLKDKDLSSIGFLGYPLLQTADVSLYDAPFCAGRARIRWRTWNWRGKSSVDSTTSSVGGGDVLVEPQPLLTPFGRLAGTRRRQEDVQEPWQHDSPVGQRG